MENIIGQTILNRYRVEGRIGLGGMSEVYRAFDQQRQITVALKFLREDLAEDPEFERRFRKEASALQRLTHPGIVRFYELARVERMLFLVMDYVDGGTLRGHMFDIQGPLPAGEVLGILTPIAAALNYAHAQGVIHRDIKPGNIMLAKDGNALLTDFGIAKFTDSATITTVMAGTPAYMSPEQCAGRPLDARSDLYSLGLLAYEMLAGRRPFVGETAGIQGVTTAERIRAEHLSVVPPSASSLHPQLPTQVDDVLARVLAKRPPERYADMLEFVQALRLALPDVVDTRPAVRIPTISTPPPQSNQPDGVKPAKTRGVLYMLGAAAVVAVLIATVMSGRGSDATPTPFVGVTNEMPTEVVAVVEANTVAPSATTAPPTDTAMPPTKTLMPPTKTLLPPTKTLLPPTVTAIPPTAVNRLVVKKASGSLHYGPGTLYMVLNILSQGTELTALERTQDSEWFRVVVKSTGEQGWLSANVVDSNFFVDTLPVASVVPTAPTATPTLIPTFPTATPAPTLIPTKGSSGGCDKVGEWTECGGKSPGVVCGSDEVSVCQEDGTWGTCQVDTRLCRPDEWDPTPEEGDGLDDYACPVDNPDCGFQEPPSAKTSDSGGGGGDSGGGGGDSGGGGGDSGGGGEDSGDGEACWSVDGENCVSAGYTWQISTWRYCMVVDPYDMNQATGWYCWYPFGNPAYN